jgi:hypothetical protein
MTKPNLILFAAAGLAIAGPCKPGSSIAQSSEVSVSYSVTHSSMVTVATSTVETLSSFITDTTSLTNEETATVSSTQIVSDTTLYTETAIAETTTGLSTELLADTTLTTIAASLSSSETVSGLTATTSATADESYECVGSIRIQHDTFTAVQGGYIGSRTMNDCAQLCEDNPSCYAFTHNSANNCWNAGEDDASFQAGSPGWTSGFKGTCPQD